MSTHSRLIILWLSMALLAAACAPAVVAPTPTESAALPTPPPPPPSPMPTAAPVIREVVAAEPVNALIETFLGFNPAYQDPRVDCAAMTGNGMILGDTGLCIPMYPQAGFCVPDSFKHPCDVLLTAVPAFMFPDASYGVGIGGAPGYVYEMVTLEVFEQQFRPLAGQPIYSSPTSTVPAWMFLNAIPASSFDYEAARTIYPQLVLSGPAPGQIPPPDVIQEIVDAEPVNHVIETMLALDPGYTDPRIACEQMEGSGMVLGDSGVCIPQYPEAGFCIPDSSAAPCDMKLFAFYSPSPYPGETIIGGRGAGYTFRFVRAEEFEDLFPQYREPQYLASLLTPMWSFITVIPASSVNIADMWYDGLGLEFSAAPGKP